ncbi:RrF2 family transcriptional regulator [Methylocapsa palsarum]|uniref:Rrf2 family protein n=1 Tax=Methylocapsa palsarum TaxID=1612308 RepID=A0A1I3YSF5_9HYPH|nr:Rrf2 family transcriptional regulator [Methylocapsa palsarum]SFK34794.1 Rrf2 family protein [Methylocapsa palsarum]
MMLLSRRGHLALAAVLDIALYARPLPVAAKALAGRLELPPRRLETLLQALVRANILKGVRGPRGGYELARERRRITAAAVLRAVLDGGEDEPGEEADCRMVAHVIAPMVETAAAAFLKELERITIDDICQRAEELKLLDETAFGPDFTI